MTRARRPRHPRNRRNIPDAAMFLNYCPDSGNIRQKLRSNILAGYIFQSGARIIENTVNGKLVRFKAERVAWFLHTGEFPKGDIIHINGDRDDNRFNNLKDVPIKEGDY